jgi:hypothetical protein
MRDERRHMMLASVALISVAATFWSLRLIKADPGNAKGPAELEALAPYIVPVAQPRVSDTSMAFGLPMSDPFDRSVPVGPRHLDVPPIGQPTVIAPPPVIPATPKWVLNGIVSTARGRTATVDDSVVTVGSNVRGGGKITKIEKDYVEIVDAQGRIHVVRLYPLES